MAEGCYHMQMMKMTGRNEVEFHYFNLKSYSETHNNCFKVITIIEDSNLPLKPPRPGYCGTNKNHSLCTYTGHKIHFHVFASAPDTQKVLTLTVR